ncbi:MAG: hypothetical protein ACYCSS_06955 [Sulfuriferula sp.]
MPFPADQFSILNPFAVILRYEETPYISLSIDEMSIDEMNYLTDLVWLWARLAIER